MDSSVRSTTMTIRWLLCLLFLSVLCSLGVQHVQNFRENFPNSDIIPAITPRETEDGSRIVQGDIVLPRNRRRNVKGVVNVVTLWPSGQVSYNFHASVAEDVKVNIIKAMKHWENRTCLRFKERQVDFNYLRYRTDKAGCFSYIGRTLNSPFSGQDVNIGKGCNHVNLIVHEIGHAIGFYHEQSRNDRDGYIDLLWDNMRNGLKSQFDKGIESPRGVIYDYTSVMHYGSMAFTSRFFEKNTMVSWDPHKQVLIGASHGLSFRDAKLANLLYTCSRYCPNSYRESECQNEGFLEPYQQDGQPCNCVCPPHTTGEFCETLIRDDYYEPPVCGGNVTEPMEIQTPGYPNRAPPADKCSWWIQAPEGHRAQVEFVDFSFRERLNYPSSKFRNRCVYERVEIRVYNHNDGEMFCDEDIPPGTVVTSMGRNFAIIIFTSNEAQDGRGLKARVSFINETQVSDETRLRLEQGTALHFFKKSSAISG